MRANITGLIGHSHIIITVMRSRVAIRKKIISFKNYTSNDLSDKDLNGRRVIHSFFPVDRREFGRWKDANRMRRRIRVGCLTRMRGGRYARFPGAEFRSRRTHGVSSAAQRYGAGLSQTPFLS